MKDDTQNKIAFLLPPETNYNAYSGGPVSNWINEIILRSNFADFSVFGVNNRMDFAFGGNIIEPFFKSFVIKIDQYLKLIHKDGWMWCLAYIGFFKSYATIIIENRPHYVLILRRLGYKGKIILHIHNDSMSQFSFKYLTRIERQTDLILFCSNYIKDTAIRKCPLLLTKSQVIYNGINTNKFKRNQLGRKDNVILYYGRIVKQKGNHNLLLAFELLCRDMDNVELWIIGSTSYTEQFGYSDYEIELTNKIHYLNKERESVKILGQVANDKLPELISTATITCLPSISTEALPVSIIESMSCGVCVVASNVGGVHELIDSILVASNNIRSLYEGLKIGLSNSELRREIEEKYIMKVKSTLDWNIISLQFEGFVMGVL